MRQGAGLIKESAEEHDGFNFLVCLCKMDQCFGALLSLHVPLCDERVPNDCVVGSVTRNDVTLRETISQFASSI